MMRGGGLTRRGALAAALAALGAGRAGAAEGISPGSGLDAIQKRGWILFGAYADNAPFSFEKDGAPAGIDIDVGRLIAKSMGVEARFRLTDADETVDADLRNNVWRGPVAGGGVVDAMLRTPWSRELDQRNELVVLGARYARERIGIAWSLKAFPKDKDSPPPLPVFRFEKIAVENDTLADFYLANLLGGAVAPNIVHHRRIDEAMDSLRKGEVGAVMGVAAQLEYGVSLAPPGHDLRVAAPSFQGLGAGDWPIGMAARDAQRALLYALEAPLEEAMASGRLKEIYAAYGATWRAPDA